MKTYFECLNEISSDELYEGLLAHGLFAEKMPPIFTSENFFNYCKNLPQPFSDFPRQYIYYEHMRNFNNPRPLGIPNPFGYQRLCLCLKDNWDKIIKHFENKTKNDVFKTSRIHIRKLVDKTSLFEMNYDNWRTDGSPEVDLLVGKAWMVKADISNCFPSMYSHALPWALAGKPTAKREQKDKSIWYNEIDHYTQNIKNGETHGFIIGPHVSNLLSEIILTTIDLELRKDWEYTRNIDDYICYVESRDEADKFLAELNKQLRNFDLLLNHKKTDIIELPIAAVENWRREILSISFVTTVENDFGNSEKVVDFKHTQLFLDKVIELMRDNDMNAAILNYALQILVQQTLTESARNYCVKTIMHYALNIPYLVPLLDRYLFSPLKVTTEEIEQYANLIFIESLKKNHYEGLSYSIFYALKYGVKLSLITPEIAIESEDCILMLLTFSYFHKCGDVTSTKKLKDHAKQLSSNDDDFNRYWLFIYEVLPSHLLTEEWKPMKRAGVSFLMDLEDDHS
jgi:hypothetical protein